MTTLELDPPFTATAKQRELACHWNDPAVTQVLIGGAIRSGKTQAAARLIVESAVEIPTTYLVARSTYRELEDSTKKALLHGDGAMPPLIPRELIAEYRASDNLVRLKTGAEILFRSLEEQNLGKLLNLTLGGILVDQIEELVGGPVGERIYDTMLGRLSDPRGPRKILAVANPAPTMHWVYRRLVDQRTSDPGTAYVHVRLTDNAANLPADYLERMLATQETRPSWYRTFVLGEWGAFEGAAFTEFDEAIHVVPPFGIPDEWDRFEGMDFGSSNPTAWPVFAADYDGNVLCFDLYYSPGLVSDHVTALNELRKEWWPRGTSATTWADPSIANKYGTTDGRGRAMSIELEFNEHGFGFVLGDNSRRGGYMRVAEMLRPDLERAFPHWHPLYGQKGAPRFYIVGDRCPQLVEQIRNAPLADTGHDAGEAVDADWESAHGHAVAATRYALMSRPSPSREPTPQPEDLRSARIIARRNQLREQQFEDVF